MDATFSLSRPHEVFLSEDILNEMDVEQGDPISFEASIGDEGTTLAAPVMPIQDIEDQQEEYSLFYILPQLSASVPDRAGDIVRERLVDDELVVDIEDSEDLSHYIHDLKYQRSVDYDDFDAVIGIDLLNIASDKERTNPVNTLFGEVPEELIIDCLNNEDIEFNRSERDFEVIEPESALFCTFNHEFPENELNNISQRIEDIGYFVYGAHHIISTGLYPIHGPVMKTDISEESPKIFKVDQGNVQFDCATRIPVTNAGDEDLDTDEIVDVLKELSDEFSVEKKDEGNRFSIKKASYFANVHGGPESLQIDLHHAFDYEQEEFIGILEDWCDELDDEVGTQLTIHQPHEHQADDALLNDVWVLDTNIVYKQYDYSRKTDICEYIFDEPKLYDKTIKIPWQVIGEINRHKDESSSLKNISKKGLENLTSLKALDEFGYLDLIIADLPDEFDNSVHPRTGMPDLGILSSVPSNGVLLTDDDRLMSLANVLDLPAENIVNNVNDGEEADVWSRMQEKLDENHLPIGELSGQIQSFISSQDSSDHQDQYDEPSDYLKRWEDDDRIVKYPLDGEVYVATSAKFEVIPTYRTVTRISNNIDDGPDGKMLTEEFLEELRSAIGRLPKCQFPKVEFIIPEQYVYRAKEVDQVQELMKISQLDNAEYRSEMVNVDRPTVQTELNEAAVKTAQSTGSILLCDQSEEELTKLSRLISVEAVTI